MVRVSDNQWRYLGVAPDDSGQVCGCDPAADHICDRHAEVLEEGKMFACVGCGRVPWDCTCRKESER